jgi:hypothetical protein
MMTDLMRGGIAVLLVSTAALVFVFTHDILVIPTTLLFIAGTALTWHADERDLYVFVAGIPLVVTAGESNLMAGVILLSITVTLLVVDVLQGAGRRERVSFLLIPIILIALVFLAPDDSRVPYISFFLLLVAVGGSLLFIVRNQLLKEQYKRDIS